MAGTINCACARCIELDVTIEEIEERRNWYMNRDEQKKFIAAAAGRSRDPVVEKIAAANNIVKRYRDNDDADYGYESALDHLILLGYSERQADDLLHPPRPLDPLEKIVGRAPVKARHHEDGISYVDPVTGKQVEWTMVHKEGRPREERRFYERQRFIGIMDADGYGVLWER